MRTLLVKWLSNRCLYLPLVLRGRYKHLGKRFSDLYIAGARDLWNTWNTVKPLKRRWSLLIQNKLEGMTSWFNMATYKVNFNMFVRNNSLVWMAFEGFKTVTKLKHFFYRWVEKYLSPGGTLIHHSIRTPISDITKCRPMQGNPRQSWILDSMPWDPDSRYSMDSSLCKRILDSEFQSLMRFRTPWAVFRIPKPRIPDSTQTFSRSADSRNKDFLDSGIWIPLRWCYTGRFATTIFSTKQRCNFGTML